jgi:hypothetical protein
LSFSIHLPCLLGFRDFFRFCLVKSTKVFLILVFCIGGGIIEVSEIFLLVLIIWWSVIKVAKVFIVVLIILFFVFFTLYNDCCFIKVAKIFIICLLYLLDFCLNSLLIFFILKRIIIKVAEIIFIFNLLLFILFVSLIKFSKILIYIFFHFWSLLFWWLIF